MINNKTLGPTTYPKRHVFLDIDNVVEWELGIYQNFHKPQKIWTQGLECGPPGSWNARVAAGWGNVLFDEGRFRLWGCSMPSIGDLKENCDIWLSSYCESEDGIHWRKPDLKITAQKRWPGNNILKLPGCVMSVVRPLPGASFKYLACTIQTAPPYAGVCDDASANFNGTGTYLFGSDDGLKWEQISRYPMVQHGDWACLHVDHYRQRYLLYHKMGVNHGLTTRRAMLVVESKDAIHWEGYQSYRQWHECFVTDDYDDQIAAAHGYKIGEYYSHTLHQTGPLYMAVQTLFMVSQPLRYIMGQNPYGKSQLRLAYSHDGIVFRHPRGRPAFVDYGEPGDFDTGFMTSASNIVEHGDDMLLYCGGGLTDHGWGIRPDFSLDADIPTVEQERKVNIFVAKFKRDRFASLASTYRARFDVEMGPRQGDDLTINAITRHRGAIRVAIAEQRSHYHLELRKSDSLPGFSFDDCVPFQGDSVRAPVRFRNAKLTDLPKNKHLTLCFEINAGEVFGYEWTE